MRWPARARPQAMRKYKLRGEERPPATMADWRRTLEYQLQTVVMFITPGVVFQLAMRGPLLYWDTLCFVRCDDSAASLPTSAPPLAELLAHVFASLFVFDLSYYMWHKYHHESRVMYRHIHAIHHQYFAPFVWVTQFLHPCEMLALSFFSMLIPCALGAHPLSQWVWLLISVQFSLEAHGGWDFPITLDKLMPFLGGPVHHDLHHQWPQTNFQPFFTYGDKLMGTEKAPPHVEAARKAKETAGTGKKAA